MNEIANRSKKIFMHLKRGGGVSRDKKLHELQMMVLAYMRSENVHKAREVLAKWEAAVKEFKNETI